MSTAEAEMRFLPKDMPGEIRLILDECVEQFGREKALVHYQRLSLFRGLVTYLYDHATFSIIGEIHLVHLRP